MERYESLYFRPPPLWVKLYRFFFYKDGVGIKKPHEGWYAINQTILERWSAQCSIASLLVILALSHTSLLGKKNFKFFCACHVNTRQQSTIAENLDAWHVTTIYVVSSLEITYTSTLKDKRHRRKNHNTMPSSPWPNLQLQLWLPLPQQWPWMCLHLMWTSPFLIFVSQNKAMMINKYHSYYIWNILAQNFKIL